MFSTFVNLTKHWSGRMNFKYRHNKPSPDRCTPLTTLCARPISNNTADIYNYLMTKNAWEEIIKHGAYSQELDWFAIDKNGNLGMFSATMLAPIPEKVKASYDSYIELKTLIDSLPKSTSYVLTTKEQGNFIEWTTYAEKGLFAFDFQDVHRQNVKNLYDLIAKPVFALNHKDINIPIHLFDTLPKLNCVFMDGDLKTELIK